MTSAARQRFRPELRRGRLRAPCAGHPRTIVRSNYALKLEPGMSSGGDGLRQCLGALYRVRRRPPASGASLIDDATVKRILRVVVARRRRVSGSDQRVDKRFVLRVERLADRGKILGPLLEGARPPDDCA